MIDQAVILAGGKGMRLRPLTENIPKPMVLVNGRPFLDYLIHSLLLVGITKLLFLIGYKGNIIQDRYKYIRGAEVYFSKGDTGNETGRRVLDAYTSLDRYFLLLYGDNYWPFELDDLMNSYKQNNTRVLTTVFSNKRGTGEYRWGNNVIVSKDNQVLGYDRKRSSIEANGVDIGYFIVDRDILDPDMKNNISFEREIIPSIITRNELSAHITDRQYFYITNVNSLKEFSNACFRESFQPLTEQILNK